MSKHKSTATAVKTANRPPTNNAPQHPQGGYDGLVKTNPDGENTITLLIGGVHCAVCIQKIESTVKKNHGITYARLNFSNGRLNISWKGDPELANDLAAQITALGYTVKPYSLELEKNSEENESRFLLLCLGIAGFAMGNIMLLSIGLWITTTDSMGMATRDLMNWLSALIGIPAIMISGRPFFKSAFSALKNRGTNMDVPISLALILACGMSLYETINHGEHVYFDSAVMLMFFLLIGRYLDFRARRSAKNAASDLMQTLSGFANVLMKDGKTKRMLIRDVQEGMRVLVTAGEKIPVDGTVQNGESSIDTSLVTGETLPRPAKPGDEVYAGTLNQSAPLTVLVTKAAENSLLADVVRLMEKAQQGQAAYVRLADKAARLYTPLVHTLAALAFLLWWGLWGLAWQNALMISVTVLIITCPCALGLAVPVVQVLASGLLMKRGVMIKSGDALERLAAIDTVFFDKTGTLTYGQPKLGSIHDVKDLKLAASLAAHSTHPLSKAIAAAYSGTPENIQNITEHPGKGLEGLWQNKKIRLGSRAWCGDKNAPQTDDPEIWLKIANQKPLCFTFTDSLRPDAAETIRALKEQHIKTILISGDREAAAQKIAKEAGIDTYRAEQSPVDKYAFLEKYKSEGRKVLMVGDGLNDAAILAGAHVSMAPGTAIDMAQNVADMIFMGDHLAPVLRTYQTAKMSQKLIKQNFILAVLYNAIAVPLAFAGLVTPLIAALAMSGSSLLVITNSFRLKLHA